MFFYTFPWQLPSLPGTRPVFPMSLWARHPLQVAFSPLNISNPSCPLHFQCFCSTSSTTISRLHAQIHAFLFSNVPPTILDITLTHPTINIHILNTYLILTSLWDKLNWSSDPSVADSMNMPRRFMALPCNFASQPLGKLIRLEAGKWSWKVSRSDHQTSSMNFVGRGTWETVHDKVWMYESSIGKKKSTSPSPTLLEKLLSSCWNSGGFREDPKKEQRGFSEWHQGRGLPIFGAKMQR